MARGGGGGLAVGFPPPLRLGPMRPAASKAPADYLAALAVAALVMVVTIWVKPPTTRWLVFGVGAVMFLSVAAAALRPGRSARR